MQYAVEVVVSLEEDAVEEEDVEVEVAKLF